MATRLAARNNLITVTEVKLDEEESDANSQITTNASDCTTVDAQRTQITPVQLHHVNLSQVKVLINGNKR